MFCLPKALPPQVKLSKQVSKQLYLFKEGSNVTAAFFHYITGWVIAHPEIGFAHPRHINSAPENSPTFFPIKTSKGRFLCAFFM
jgi:hypothetical protein